MTKAQHQVFWNAIFRRTGGGTLNAFKNRLIENLDSYGFEYIDVGGNCVVKTWKSLYDGRANEIVSSLPDGESSSELNDVVSDANKMLGFTQISGTTDWYGYRYPYPNTYQQIPDYSSVGFSGYYNGKKIVNDRPYGQIFVYQVDTSPYRDKLEAPYCSSSWGYDYYYGYLTLAQSRYSNENYIYFGDDVLDFYIGSCFSGTQWWNTFGTKYYKSRYRDYTYINAEYMRNLDAPEFIEVFFDKMRVFEYQTLDFWDAFLGLIINLYGGIASSPGSSGSSSLYQHFGQAIAIASVLYYESRRSELQKEAERLLAQMEATSKEARPLAVEVSEDEGEYDLDIEYIEDEHDYEYGISPIEINDVYTGKFKLK